MEENPRKNSAELNALLSFLEKRGIKEENYLNIYFYLIETTTASGELSAEIIRTFLKKKGFKDLGSPKEVHGYFRELTEGEDKVERFQKGLTELLNATIYVAKRKSKEGFKVYFNPTGGMKAHVIMLGLASALSGFPAYYIHEEFKDVIEIPPLLFKPSQEERQILFTLKEAKRKKLWELEGLMEDKSKLENTLYKLSNFGLVELRDEDGKIIEARITPLGEIITSNL